MAGRQRLAREHIATVSDLLKERGIQYTLAENNQGHPIFRFQSHGKHVTFVCSGSGDWRAIKNSLSNLRRLIEYGSVRMQ